MGVGLVTPSSIWSLTRVEVPWPEGATGLRLGGVTWTPRTARIRAGDPIQVLYSGPDDERLDLVFLGDGYTQAELGRFAADVDGVVDHLLSLEPYGQYAGLFNVWRVDTASATSEIGSGGTMVPADSPGMLLAAQSDNQLTLIVPSEKIKSGAKIS